MHAPSWSCTSHHVILVNQNYVPDYRWPQPDYQDGGPMNTITIIFTGLAYISTGVDPAVLSNSPVRVIMPTTDHTTCIDAQSGVIPPHVAFIMYEESQRASGTRPSDSKV